MCPTCGADGVRSVYTPELAVSILDTEALRQRKHAAAEVCCNACGWRASHFAFDLLYPVCVQGGEGA